MAAAIRLVTVAKGANPADYLLVAFGSAAPQHACAVARELGIRQVLIHPDAGILSAVGIGMADVSRHGSCGIERTLDRDSLRFARQRLDELERAATERGASRRHRYRTYLCNAIPRSAIQRRRELLSRSPGRRTTISTAAFAAAHRERYGYIHANRPWRSLPPESKSSAKPPRHCNQASEPPNACRAPTQSTQCLFQRPISRCAALRTAPSWSPATASPVRQSSPTISPSP